MRYATAALRHGVLRSRGRPSWTKGGAAGTTPSLASYTDAFTDADATDLASHTPTGGGFSWVKAHGTGNATITSNAVPTTGANASGSVDVLVYYVDAETSAWQSSQVVVTYSGNIGFAGPMVRAATGANTGYRWIWNQYSNYYVIQKFVNDSPLNLVTYTPASVPTNGQSDTLLLEVTANASGHAVLKGYIGGVLRAEVTDQSSPITSGKVAIVVPTASTAPTLDTFAGAELEITESFAFDPGVIIATPGDTEVALSFSVAPSGGNTESTVTYQWRRGTTSGVLSNISGATSSTHTDTGRTNGTTYYYDCVVGDGVDSESTAEVSAVPTTATPFASDGFETGDFSYSENGFSWGVPKNCVVSAADPITGTYSCEFNYPAKSPNSDAEQRFNLPGVQEVWFQFDVKIPLDYEHPNVEPTNKKWWFLSDSLSSSYNVRFLLESWRGDGSGASPSITQARPMWGTDAAKGGVASSSWGMANPQGLVREEDLGQVLNWRFHLKISDTGSSNGIFRMWKNGTLFIDETGLPNDPVDGVSNEMTRGYLMGWANAGFNVVTTFQLDNLQWFTSNPGW